MSDFKKRVLNPSLKEINLKTNIEASYKQDKEGVKITGFKLISKYKKIVKPKIIDVNKAEKNEEKISQVAKKIPKLTDSQIETFGDKLYKNFDFRRDVVGQGSEFVGKSEAESKLIIKEMLADQTKLNNWQKHMLAVGYCYPEKQN